MPFSVTYAEMLNLCATAEVPGTSKPNNASAPTVMTPRYNVPLARKDMWLWAVFAQKLPPYATVTAPGMRKREVACARLVMTPIPNVPSVRKIMFCTKENALLSQKCVIMAEHGTMFGPYVSAENILRVNYVKVANQAILSQAVNAYLSPWIVMIHMVNGQRRAKSVFVNQDGNRTITVILVRTDILIMKQKTRVI